MGIEEWYHWVLTYMYGGASVMVFLATAVLAWKYRSVPLIIAAIGMFVFVIGTYGGITAQKVLLNAITIDDDRSSILSKLFLWRVSSTVGFFLGSLSLLFYATKGKGNAEADATVL